jgi:hypothetical protein
MSDPEKIAQAEASHADGPIKSGIEAERAQLLANLPDPDEGKSEEEKRIIVSTPASTGW